MPPKKGKTTKKRLPRESEEDDILISHVDVQYNPDIIPNLLAELREKVEAKCKQIDSDTAFMIMSIRESYNLQLIQVPTMMKKMSVKQFKEKCGDSMLQLIQNAIEAPAKSAKTVQDAKVFETPSHKRNMARQVLQTPSMRNPREGEEIMSANGSPLGEFSTVKKPARHGYNSFVPPTPGVFVPLKSGDVLDIDNVDIDNMTEEVKQDTLEQMQAVMENMAALMAKLKPTKI